MQNSRLKNCMTRYKYLISLFYVVKCSHRTLIFWLLRYLWTKCSCVIALTFYLHDPQKCQILQTMKTIADYEKKGKLFILFFGHLKDPQTWKFMVRK